MDTHMTDPPPRPAYLRTATGPDDLYTGKPPWDIGRPQPAFLALADAGEITGRVLDVGCGTGEHVLMAAGLGLDATGVDLASAALDAATQKARDRGRTARFLRWDALKLADLGESFDTVLDSGLFHHIDEKDRAAYVGGVRSVLVAGGRYFMLFLGDSHSAQHGDQPEGRRYEGTTAEIEAAFAGGWRIDSIEAVTVDTTIDPGGLPAWRIALTRI
jgi:cyclopropane fatty-acyl-phospholipid synthase-like methyltransferase